MARAFECRFGIGDPWAFHSAVWIARASRNKPDCYITARSMGGAIKASFHARERRHVGLTSEHITKAFSRADLHDSTRHFDTWTQPYSLGSGATLEFLLRFPTSQLRPFPLRASDFNKVRWVPAAPPGEVIEVGMLCFEPGTHPEFMNTGTAIRIADGTLIDGRQVWLVSRTVLEGQFTNRHTIKDEIRAQWQACGTMPADLHESIRLMIFFNDSGVRGWTEMAGDWLR